MADIFLKSDDVRLVRKELAENEPDKGGVMSPSAPQATDGVGSPKDMLFSETFSSSGGTGNFWDNGKKQSLIPGVPKTEQGPSTIASVQERDPAVITTAQAKIDAAYGANSDEPLGNARLALLGEEPAAVTDSMEPTTAPKSVTKAGEAPVAAIPKSAENASSSAQVINAETAATGDDGEEVDAGSIPSVDIDNNPERNPLDEAPADDSATADGDIIPGILDEGHLREFQASAQTIGDEVPAESATTHIGISPAVRRRMGMSPIVQESPNPADTRMEVEPEAQSIPVIEDSSVAAITEKEAKPQKLIERVAIDANGNIVERTDHEGDPKDILSIPKHIAEQLKNGNHGAVTAAAALESVTKPGKPNHIVWERPLSLPEEEAVAEKPVPTEITEVIDPIGEADQKAIAEERFVMPEMTAVGATKADEPESDLGTITVDGVTPGLGTDATAAVRIESDGAAGALEESGLAHDAELAKLQGVVKPDSNPMIAVPQAQSEPEPVAETPVSAPGAVSSEFPQAEATYDGFDTAPDDPAEVTPIVEPFDSQAAPEAAAHFNGTAESENTTEADSMPASLVDMKPVDQQPVTPVAEAPAQPPVLTKVGDGQLAGAEQAAEMPAPEPRSWWPFGRKNNSKNATKKAAHAAGLSGSFDASQVHELHKHMDGTETPPVADEEKEEEGIYQFPGAAVAAGSPEQTVAKDEPEEPTNLAAAA